MLSTSAKTLVDIHSGLKFARNPRWNGESLLFLDVHDRCIKSTNLKGEVKTVTELPYLPDSLEVLADGRLIVGDASRRKMYLYETDGPKLIADLSNIAGSCLSESVVDSRGGMYVSDVGFDFLDPLVDPVANGLIVHICLDGKMSVVAESLFSPNGLVVTPDNKTLIVAETLAHRLTAFEIDPSGALGHRRVWAEFSDDIRPDGICRDLDGAIWVAGTGPAALRVKEGGDIDHEVTTKRPVFATMLGGPERRHLFMCTSSTNDPVMTRQMPGATIDIAEVDTPGRIE